MILQINITREIIIAICFTGAFGTMFFIAEMVYLKMRVDAEITRKFIHVTCGSIAMLIPVVKPNIYTIIILGIFFTLLTWYLLKKGLLPSVHAVKRNSIGSVLFPIGIVCCTLFGLLDSYKAYFYIPMCTLIFSDTVAALVGINFPIRKFTVMGYTKSIGGALGFLVSAISIFISFYFNSIGTIGLGYILCGSLIFGIAITVVESISVNGWDDLSVPVSAFCLLFLFHYFV